jgi:hypothetical protein
MSAPSSIDTLSPFEILLREPSLAARRALEGGEPATRLARSALLTLALGAMLFGAVIGSYRGELQSLYAAIKMPVVLIGALVVTTPAVWALGASSGRAWSLRAVSALVLVAAGRASLVLVTVAPLLWVAIDLGAGYHFSTLLATMAFSLAGLVALATLLRGVGTAGLAVVACAAIVFLSGLAQTGWALRPWLGRPARPVSFVRTEAGVGPLESVLRSFELGTSDPSGRDIEGP